MHSETLHSVEKTRKKQEKALEKAQWHHTPHWTSAKADKRFSMIFPWTDTLFKKTVGILLQFTKFSRIFYNLYSGYHKTCERSLLWYENMLDWMKDSHFDFYFWRENLD